MNDYPLSFIDTIIGIQLSKYRCKENDVARSIETKTDKKRMYVEVPFIKDATVVLKSKILHLCNKLRPDLDIHFVMKPPPSIHMLYQTKDPIHNQMKSGVVYSIKCSTCEHYYIGKTERQCIRRLIEHGAPKSLLHYEDEQEEENDIEELRRSQRLKTKKLTSSLPSTTIFRDKDDTTSAVKQHEVETGHRMNWSNFRVVTEDNHPYRLLIKESLLIKAFEPELNRTTHSVPLVIFPDGLPKFLLPKPVNSDSLS